MGDNREMPNYNRCLNPYLQSWIVALTLISFLVTPGFAFHTRNLPLSTQAQVEMLLECMTPEERVGQLFLITFQGTDVGEESQIFDLITEHHVGGVVLLAKNDNFIDDEQSPTKTTREAYSLIEQIQQDEWDYSQQSRLEPATGESYLPNYIPLFIGISQEGDGYPYDQILHGMTELPNAMTLGATWNPDLASQAGSILGKELRGLGINLLLGPSLDVLESPQLELTNNLGTRTFGGDPYWVAEMGRAYIRGVHLGSKGQVAVVAKHFPGHGGSDRLPEEEVATVRKSLDELTSFDLPPFYAVTGNAQAPEEVVDALLTSHIRYRGLQGNIRAATRPVSFDPQALNLLMALPSLSSWRINGGILVSDNLGGLAVRRYYDLSIQAFDARRVALNAFLSGNDLLYIDDFSSIDTTDSYTAALRTLEFFIQKYREDSAFAQRVDESVSRILKLKYRLYQDFTLDNVLSDQGNLTEIGQSNQTSFERARQAATLINPTQAELDEIIPDPPGSSERILFVSETNTAQQCNTCPTYQLLDQWAMQDAVLRLFGPQAGGQILASHLTSFSMGDLQKMLGGELEDNAIEAELSRANWIVFLMLSNSSTSPSFQTLRDFLTERPDLFQSKRLIAFALCAPYYLDATNISKLTAYYSLYSKIPQSVDVAAYLLFGELRASGVSPVSIPGISYNLNESLFPDPDQLITLELDLPNPEAAPETTGTPTAIPSPQYRIGDVIPLRTGSILDYNGHLVPDGTPVSFVFTIGGESNSTRQVQYTKDGVARTTYAIKNSGTLEIRAESENARSDVLQFDIPSPGGESATIAPTETPTQIPSPTPSETPVQPPATPVPPSVPNPPGLVDWIMAVLISGTIALISYRLSVQIGQVRWGVRSGFLAFIGGLLSYSFIALQIPNGKLQGSGSISLLVFLSSLVGSILGLAIVFCWKIILQVRQRNISS
jgi:beta-N-acetylhexosaminidase